MILKIARNDRHRIDLPFRSLSTNAMRAGKEMERRSRRHVYARTQRARTQRRRVVHSRRAARTHTYATERYVLTLCNGRIKDGPTPVKAPHTRRRLTTLLPPSFFSVLSLSLSTSSSLSFAYASFSHRKELSLSFYLHLRPPPLSL